MAQTVKNLPAMQKTQVQSLGQEEGTGNSLQYSCLENPMDRGGWWATAHGVANRWTLTKHKQAQATNTSIPSIPMWPGAVLIPRASRPVGIIESRGFVGSEHFEFIEANKDTHLL